MMSPSSVQDLSKILEDICIDTRIIDHLNTLSISTRQRELLPKEIFLLRGSIADLGYEDLSRISKFHLENDLKTATLRINGAALFEWMSQSMKIEVKKKNVGKVLEDFLSERVKTDDAGRSPIPQDVAASFYGREEEIIKLTRYVEVCSTLVIVGVPGIGKTALAHEFVKRQAVRPVTWVTNADQFLRNLNSGRDIQSLGGAYIFESMTSKLFCEYEPLLEKIKDRALLILLVTERLVGKSHMSLTLKGLKVSDSIKIPEEFGFSGWEEIVDGLGGHPQFIRQYAGWAQDNEIVDHNLLSDASVQLGYFQQYMYGLFSNSMALYDKKLLLFISKTEGVSLTHILTHYKRAASRVAHFVNSGILNEVPEDSPKRYIVPKLFKKFILENWKEVTE